MTCSSVNFQFCKSLALTLLRVYQHHL